MEHDIHQHMHELQALEQQVQQLLATKQQLQMEHAEVTNALTEITRADDELFKVLGGIMMKVTKAQATKELAEKEKILAGKITSVEKQEKQLASAENEIKKHMQSHVETKKEKN